MLNQAPNAGPNVNAIQKHAPTIAIVAPRCFSSLISVAIAVAIWTLPSLKPPTTRDARKVRKSVAHVQSRTERMLPIMEMRSARRRPYLSDRRPIIGDAMA